MSIWTHTTTCLVSTCKQYCNLNWNHYMQFIQLMHCVWLLLNGAIIFRVGNLGNVLTSLEEHTSKQLVITVTARWMKSSDSVSTPGKQHDQSVHVYISFLTFHALSFENLSSLSLASASSFAVGPPLPPDGSSMDGRLTRVICTGRQQSKVFQSKRANQHYIL